MSTPTPDGTLWSWTLSDRPSKLVRPFPSWDDALANCSMVSGDQPRTGSLQVGREGCVRHAFSDTPLNKERKGRKNSFSGYCPRPTGLLPLLEQALWTKKNLQGTFLAAPSAPSLAVTKSPERPGQPSWPDQDSVAQRLNY